MTATGNTIDIAPYLSRERELEANRLDRHQAEIDRNRFNLRPRLVAEHTPASEAELLERAQDNAVKAAAWSVSPRGRFVHACHGLRQTGYDHTADRVMGFYHRGFQMGSDVKAMQAALAELVSVPALDETAAGFAAAGAQALVELIFAPAATDSSQ